jgi:hypothetical protein
VGVIALLTTSVAVAQVFTDKADYAPGSTVTISGDNSNGAGYLVGETVHVEVFGPEGYAGASCEDTVTTAGSWSCKITLPIDAPPGEYPYTATGLTSGVTESSSFTDAIAPGSLCNTPAASTQCAGATSLAVHNSTHYKLQVGTKVTGKIVGATDIPCSGTVSVIIKSSTLGNTTVKGSVNSKCTITFSYTAPKNGCDTSIVAYSSNGNNSNNDIIADGVDDGTPSSTGGYAFVDKAGKVISCEKKDTPTKTPTKTKTPTATATATYTPTKTSTPTDTPTKTSTPTDTFTPTATDTFTPTATDTFTPTATDTFTPTATDTFTPTATDTFTPTATDTFTPTATDTFTPTKTSTPTDTPTKTSTPTPTLGGPQGQGTPELVKLPELANLWLCQPVPACVNPAAGIGARDFSFLLGTVITGTSPKGEPQSLGSFEYEVRYDAKLVNVSVQPGGLFLVGGLLRSDVDCQTIEGQGFVQFRCNVKGKSGVPITGPGFLAVVRVTPTADVYSLVIASQENGIGTQIINQDCAIGDLQGHPIDSLNCDDAELILRYLEGDTNADCEVDVQDGQEAAFRWGSHAGQLLYNYRFDLEPAAPKLGDGDIDALDLQMILGRHGSTCAEPHPPQDPAPLK